MTNDQARIILAALVHDGIDVRQLTDKARQEIRRAFEVVLELAGDAPQ